MKRYIITATGGLGNQIMTYALWYYLSKSGESMLYLKRNDLNRVFPLLQINSSKSTIIDLYIAFYKRYNAYIIERFKLQGAFKRLFGIVVDYPEWKDYLFLADIQTELKQDLEFTPHTDYRNIELMEYMKECNSVSIHIRRGDYQNDVYWRIMLGDICDEVYYNKAINEVYKIVEEPVFFIFSDDILWVKENLAVKDAVYVDWNVGKESYRDMQLMSYCKINILANSTFSLSATWLNINPNPIRIVPSKWSNFYDDKLLDKCIPKEWIIIDNKRPMVSIIIKENVSEENIHDILKQSFTDFEIIYLNANYNNIDSRVTCQQPTGKFYYGYDTCTDIRTFKKKKYLYNWLRGILYQDLAHK